MTAISFQNDLLSECNRMLIATHFGVCLYLLKDLRFSSCYPNYWLSMGLTGYSDNSLQTIPSMACIYFQGLDPRQLSRPSVHLS